MSTQTFRGAEHPTKPSALDFRAWSRRTASLVAGFALTAMAVLTPVGYYGLIVPLIDRSDADATAAAIADAPVAFLGGVVAVVLVILLDVLVAGATYSLFRGVDPRLSAIAAWVRVVYAGVFAVAAGELVNAFVLVSRPERSLAALDSFSTIWLASLGIFGIHLLLVAALIIRADFISTVFGVLLAIAGVGYLVDAVATVFGLHLPVTFGSFGFVGEVAFIFWLFIKGRTLRG